MSNATTRLGVEVTAANGAGMLGKLTAGLAVVYAAIAVGYAVFWRPELFALTAGSSLALALIWLARRGRELSPLLVTAVYLLIGLVVIANVTLEYAVSGDPIHAIPFLFTQLAVGFFVPTIRFLALFFATNIGSWLTTSLALAMTERLADGAIGFATTTGIGALIFVGRVRNNGKMEELRRAVEKSRDRDLREIIDKHTSAVFLVRDGQVIYANATAADSLMCESVAELVGRPLESLVTDPDKLAELTRADRDRSMIAAVKRADGERLLFDFARAVTIDFEHAVATMLTARDVTRSQEELNARLLLADRMSVAGTLARGVAHEINNPLSFVDINLGALEQSLDPASESAGLVAEVKAGFARVTTMVEDLAAVSRITDNRDEVTDPIAALRTAAQATSNRIEEGVELDFDLQPLPEVAINDGKLVQVFLNVLLNAVDAVGEGGSEIAVRACTAGRFAVVEVRDDGPGMSERVRRRIFEPFFTTKGAGRNTGLGMFFCHEVVTAAGGTIGVDSSEGGGTRVVIRLPLADESKVSAPRFARASSLPVPTGFRILVIDDEPLVGQAIKRVLARYQVSVALDGASGVELFRRDRYDLVLCDLMMPGMSGERVYEELVAIDPTVSERIVFVTGGAFTPETREFANRVNEQVVKKPLEVDDLLDLVDRAAQRQNPTLNPPLA